MRHLAWLTLFATFFPAKPAHAQTLSLRAGRLLQCTLKEPSLSSKTASPGDPARTCRPAREFGRFAFPHGSYLAGRFSDSRDPGRIAGKGWMKLEFDRLIAVRRFRADEEGKIIGQGHPTRDAGFLILTVLNAPLCMLEA